MHVSSLAELPPAPLGKTGWPWTEPPPQLPQTMPNGSPWPQISIVTPSYNQGQFLEETIRSVLLQGYPNLEYIIIDGGSTDESVEIVKRYAPWLTYWISEPDRGQSHAINKGLERTTGEIIAYLNSDDIYLSNALTTVAMTFYSNPGVGMVTGGINYVDENSILHNVKFPKLPTTPVDLTTLEPESWFIPQASSFILRKILSVIGAWVREELHYTMDRELFYRAVYATKVCICHEVLATYRQHSMSKTTAYIITSYEETRKSFAYCDWGTITQKKLRSKILKKRIAQGYYNYAYSNMGIHAFRYLVKAVYLRPEYLVSTSFIKNTLAKIILTILRRE